MVYKRVGPWNIVVDLLNSHREQRRFPGLVSFVAIKPEKVYACSWRLNHIEVITQSKTES